MINIASDGTITIVGGQTLAPGTGINVDLPFGVKVNSGGNGNAAGILFADGSSILVGNTGITTVTLPNGTTVVYATDGSVDITTPFGAGEPTATALDDQGRVIANNPTVQWWVNEVTEGMINTYGPATPVSSTSSGPILTDADQKRFRLGVKVGSRPIFPFFVRVSKEQRIVLLLHGMNSDTATWDQLVLASFGGSATDIVDGNLVGQPPTPNAQNVRCYRLQFGFYDLTSLRSGVENLQTTPDYLLNHRCGDFETFAELGLEVEQAIAAIRLQHRNARVLLASHSRGGIASRVFLQNPSPSFERRIVVGLLTTSSPHRGSRLGRIHDWLRSHVRNAPGTDEDDWETVDQLRTKADFDVRRPVIGDLADTSGDIALLNTLAQVPQFSSSVRVGEIVYGGAALGILKKNVLGAFTYTIFDVAGGNLGEQVSDDCRDFLLGVGMAPENYMGDGIVRMSDQRFTDMAGFLGTRVTPTVVTNPMVVHIEATARTGDLQGMLKSIKTHWFP